MKFIASIIAVYILVLTVIPCPDVPEGNILHKTENSQTTDHHQKDIDHCSPFCTCSCCSSSVVYYHISYDLKCLFFSNQALTSYITGFISSNSVSIWRPPKLS